MRQDAYAPEPDDTVRCWKCGFSFRYLPTGFLVGEDIPFDNLRDWTRWQKGEIVRLCDEAEDKPIFTDTDVRVDTVASGSGTKLLGRGDMRLFRSTLELPKAEIPVSKITGVSLMARRTFTSVPETRTMSSGAAPFTAW